MSLPTFSERHKNQQKFVEAVHSGASEFQASIIASRILKDSASDLINPKSPIVKPSDFKDLDKSANRISRAIGSGEMIYIAFDFEIESVASASILYKAITEFFHHSKQRIRMLSSNRIIDGFGFTNDFLERVINVSPKPSLIISVNQSSVINSAIKDFSSVMKENGMFGDVISVSNKKASEDMVCKDLFGVINPNNPKNISNQPATSGVLTMMLVSRIKAKLENKGLYKKTGKLNDLLPLVLIGSLDESNNMASGLNRFMIKLSMRKIANCVDTDTIPPWLIALSELVNTPPHHLNTTEAFKTTLSPILTAASMSEKNALLAVKLLVASNVKDARRYLYVINKDNKVVVGKKNPIALYLENAEKQLMQTPSTAVTYTSKQALGVLNQAVDGIVSEFGCVAGVFTNYTMRQKQIPTSFLEDNNLDFFKDMDDRVIVDLPNSEQIVVSKAIKTTLPSFELFSVFGNDVRKIKDLSLDEAIKLSPKKLFKGMASKLYTIDTPFGEVCFDITSWRKPKLYTNNIHEIKGVVRSPESINLKEIIKDIQNMFPKIFLDLNGTENLQNIQIKFDQFSLFKKEIDERVEAAVVENNLHLKPMNLVDSLCDRVVDYRLLEEINELEPFGNHFQEPTFKIKAKVDKVFVIKGRRQYRVTCANHGESLILTHSTAIECKLNANDEFVATVMIKNNIDGKTGVSLVAKNISKI